MEDNLPLPQVSGQQIQSNSGLAGAIGTSLEKSLEYAKTLADSELLPKHLKKNPASILLIWQASQELGIGLTVAIANFYVVNGNLTAKSDFMIDRARVFGHRVTHKIKDKGRDSEVTTTVVRREHLAKYDQLKDLLLETPSEDEAKIKRIEERIAELEHSSTWNWKKAVLAGVVDKDTWQNYPHTMMRHRADSEVIRAACGEVLGMIQYTPEELGAEVREDGSYLITTAEPSRATTPAASRPAIPAAKPNPAPAARPVTRPTAAPAASAAPAPKPATAASPAPAARPATVTGTVVSKTDTPVTKPATQAAVSAPSQGTATLELPEIKGTMTVDQAQDLFGAVYELLDAGRLPKTTLQEITSKVEKLRVHTKLIKMPTQDGTAKKILLGKALLLLSASNKLV